MIDLSFVDRFLRLTGRAVSYIFLLIAAVIAFEVVSRYLFNAPTIWAHELTAAMTAIGFLIGGPYALALNEHIRITSLYMHFPPLLRHAADIVSSIVTLFYIGGMFYAAWIVADRAWERLETSGSAWNQPTPVVIKTMLVVASVLIAVQTVVNLLRLLGIARHEPVPEE